MSTCDHNCESCESKDNCDHKLIDRMDKIKNKIMVLSGKGGVGKSSVAASLALSLASQGNKVGLLDLDFHGPSIPTLFGVQGMSLVSDGENMIPLEAKGIKLLSVGFLLENQDSAVIWRGPMKMGVIQQFLRDVEWGELDYLIMDFPPGTGDEALSACQTRTQCSRGNHCYNPSGSLTFRLPEKHRLLPEAEPSDSGRYREHERICLSQVRRGNSYFLNRRWRENGKIR